MNVLITNSRLDGPGGSQIFVRDLGLALCKLGHSVMAFCCDPGKRERMDEAGMIPTTADLRALPFRPDIIHAQHHLDAMAAIIALPGVPAVYHCHGAVWREKAPRHPRIHHYLAMSRTLAERMVVESNIPPEDITTWLNTVDCSRFATVRHPSPVPLKALFYNKIHRMGSHTLDVIREATSRLGIHLDFISHKFGNAIKRPEDVLPGYDIVFASGKSAIDAMACGCAVVVLGRTSCGELVVPANYERLRQVNFAIAVNSPPATVEKVTAELLRYAPDACSRVTTRLRQDADMDTCVATLEGIYTRAIARHLAAGEDMQAESRAVLAYLRGIVPIVRGAELAPVIEPPSSIHPMLNPL